MVNIVYGSALSSLLFSIPKTGLPNAHVVLRANGDGNKRTLVSDYEDRVSISNAAKQLHLHIRGNEEGAEKAERSWERVAKGSDNKSIRLMDKHISLAGDILERMKKLAEAAQDETISKPDRIELQIEMGRLQHSLNLSSEAMTRAIVSDFASGAEEYAFKRLGIYEDSDAYKMLERVRERIANGEEWDVAEIATGIYKIGGDIPRGNFALPCIPDKVFVGGEWQISDDETVASVGDILKSKGRSVMDAEAAALTAEELEKDLTALADKRGQLIALINKNSESPENPKEAAALEEKLTLLTHNVADFMQSLFRRMVQTTQGQDKDEQGNLAPAPTLVPQASFDEEDASAMQIKYTHSPVPYEEFSLYA
jgi:hypothetical protein